MVHKCNLHVVVLISCQRKDRTIDTVLNKPTTKIIILETIAGITDRCLFWFSMWGWGGYLGHKGGPGSVVISGAFLCCLFKEIWCMPLQMPHYSYDKQVWK